MRTEPLAAAPVGNRAAPLLAEVSGAGGSPRWVDASFLAALAFVWIVLALLANPIGDFPTNDDWVYGLAVKSILEHGEFRLPSPSSSNLFAQAYWGAIFCVPFGFSFTALRISTLVLGLVGIWASFGTLRELGANSKVAAIGAALLAGNPLYFALANGFMTDVPFFAVSALSLFFLVRWALRLKPRDALLGLLIAMVAILIRQIGIVIPLAFAVAFLFRRGLTPRTIALAVAPVLIGLALHLGFQAWLLGTGRTPLAPEPPVAEMIAENLRNPLRVPMRLLTFFAYIGLFSLPLLAVVASRAFAGIDSARRRLLFAVFGIAAAAFVAAIFVIRRPMPFLDNVLNAFGVGPLTLTDTYFYNSNVPIVPFWLQAFWNVATIGALLGTGTLAAMAAHCLRADGGIQQDRGRSAAMILVAAAGIAYVLIGALVLRLFYDRYALFLLLPAVVLIGSVRAEGRGVELSKKSTVALVAVLGLQAAFAVLATRDYLEWNRQRWVATAALMAQGVPRTSIDGGYEFNGWLGYDASYRKSPGKSPWWVVDDEYLVASGPVRGYSVRQAYPFKRLLTGRDSQIVVLQRDGP